MHILFIAEELYNEHLGIMSLSSALKKAGHSVDIAEAMYDKVRIKLKNNNFTILAYSAYSFAIPHYLNLNRKIKESFKVFSIFGGPHATMFPEIIEEDGVDGICIGEGEYALLNLVNSLSKSKPIANIANLWIKQNSQIFYSPAMSFIKDLDSLPFADRSLFPHSFPTHIMTSRGCPYKCSFCLESSQFRRRSVDNVIQELKEIRIKTRLKFIYFTDATFNSSHAWLKEFSEKYRKEIRLPFFCSIRADLVTPESAGYLKDAGCFSVTMAIESANDYLRNEILKKGISKEQIISAAKIIKKYKIRLRTSNMLGIPFGSLDDDLETLRLNIKCHSDYARGYIFSLFKNTDLYNLLAKESKAKYLVLNSKGYDVLRDSNNSHNEMHKIENLQKIFGVVVEFPFLLPLVPFLIKLPLSRFYSVIFFFWQGYCFYFRIMCGYLLGQRHSFIKINEWLKLLRLKRSINVSRA